MYIHVYNHMYIHVYNNVCFIREYGSTLYVGMAPKKNGRPYISIGTNELKSLQIHVSLNTQIPFDIECFYD